MKHKLTSNLGLKIVALFFAALLWLIVVNVDDPVDSQVYRNVIVEVTNEDVITSNGKTYQILDQSETISVTVTAKRSILSKIKSEDIIATADFKDMELVSLVPITVYIAGHEGDYKSAVANPHNLQVKVDDIASSSFPLTVSTTGTLRDGYVQGDVTVNPKTITVRGSETLINSIDKAVARIKISGLSESSTVDADLVLYDKEGNVIDQTLLNNNLGKKGLTVDVQVLETKELTITANTSGTPESGYVCTGVTCEPQTLTVSGTEADLKELKEIYIPSSELDISGLTKKKDFVVDISQYLPDNIGLVDNSDGNIMVTATIEQAGKKTVELLVESITVNNLASNLKLTYKTSDNLQLQFEGSQGVLKKLDIRNGAFIDLSTYTKPGTYKIPVSIDAPSGATLVSSPEVQIILSEK